MKAIPTGPGALLLLLFLLPAHGRRLHITSRNSSKSTGEGVQVVPSVRQRQPLTDIDPLQSFALPGS